MLRKRLSSKGLATGLGDEGGFAPEIGRPEDVLDELVAAITDAGCCPGETVSRSPSTRRRRSSTATAVITWTARCCPAMT